MYLLWVIPVVILLAGAGIAFIPAYFAVRARRRAAVLEETKVTSVDRLRPGLRKVKGRVVAHDRLLRSPMTRQDCVFFRFVVEEMHTHHHGKHGTSHHWVKIIDDHQSIPISIDDETGEIDVHLGGAEVVMRDQAFNSSGTFNDPPERLRRLMENEYGKSTKGWLFNKTLRYTETVLEDGADVTVVGEVEQRKGALSMRKGAMPLFVSDKGDRQLGSHHRNRAVMLWIVTGVVGFFTLVGVGISGIIAAAGTAASRSVPAPQASSTPAPDPPPPPPPAPVEVAKGEGAARPPQPRPRPARVPRPAPEKRAPLSDEEVTAAVAGLRPNDYLSTLPAARKLAAAGVTEARRDEVERALWPVLRNFNPEVRGAAYQALGVWGTQDSVPALRARLAVRDVWSHRDVFRVLGKIRHPDASEVLVAALADPQDRPLAAEALKAQGPVAEAAVLRFLAKADRSELVVEACGILDEVGTKAALPQLEKLSRDPELKVAQAAVDALEGIKERGTPPPFGAEEGPVRPRPRPKRPKPPERAPSPAPSDAELVLALDDLRSGDFGKRKRAADLLARSGLDAARQVEVEKALWPLLDDPNAGLRVAALAALRVWGTEDSVPALKAALRRRQEDSHAEVLQALGAIRHASASEVLAEAMHRPDDRAEAARALKAQGPVAEPAVLRLLSKAADPALAAAACGVLDEVGTKAALPELQRLARSPDRGVAQAAVDAVEGVRERPEAAPPAPVFRPPQRPPATAAEVEVVRNLVGLGSRDFFTIKGSAEALGRTPVFEPRRAEVEKALRPLINNDNPFLRGAALGALRTWATKDTLPALKDAVARRVPFTHGDALRALGAIKDPSATAVLVAELANGGDRAAAAAGLKAQGPMAERKVLPLLKSADAGVVSAACEVLGEVGTKASVPELQRVSRLPVPWVAQAAVTALQKLKGEKRPPGPAPSAPSRVELNKALEGLRSPNLFVRKNAADLLARSKVDEASRPEVEKALQSLLKGRNAGLRRAALAALGVWGTKDSVPALKAALTEGKRFRNRDTLKTLGAIKDAAATDVLLEAWARPVDRADAVAALKAQGPVAEPGVLRLLGKTADAGQAAELCGVLREVGTKASLAELERLSGSPDARLAEAARAARDAVRRRTGGG